MSESTPAPSKRIVSIDQLRGYAILGMMFVNTKGLFGLKADNLIPKGQEGSGLLGHFCEQISHHKEQFTWADTIAPLFVFVVGMAMRLSWLRRSEVAGPGPTRHAMLKRYTVLVLIAFALYTGWLWDALMDIGLAGLLAICLIDKKPSIRLISAFAMAGAYQAVCTWTIYGPWITRTVKLTGENTPLWIKIIPNYDSLFDVALNGGPLGPLSWCMILLFGSVAYDIMASRNSTKIIARCAGWGAALCAAGYALALPWGEIKAAWPISAYYMTLPFPLWATGLCLFHLLAFYLICDKAALRIPTLTVLGMNPFFLYILLCIITYSAENLSLPVPGSLLGGLAGFALFYAAFAALAAGLHQKRIYFKI